MEVLKDLVDILRKAGCPENVIRHCIAVCNKALEIASRCKISVDKELILVGALLHDIGRSRTHGIEHGVVGAEIARNFGFDERIIRIIERHIGAGIPKEEAERLGLPPRDYVPETIEEKIVAYADNLTKGEEYITFEEALEEFKRRLGDNHPAIERFIRLHKELQNLQCF